MNLFDKYRVLFILGVMAFLLYSCNPSGPLKSGQTKLKIQSQTKWLADNTTGSKIQKVSCKQFDKESNLISLEEFDEDGVIQTRSTFSYSDKSSLEKRLYFNDEGVVDSSISIEYIFGEAGRKQKKMVYNDNGTLISIEKFDYDAEGNLVKRVELDTTGSISDEVSYENNYNSEGNLVNRYVNPGANGTYQARDSLYYEKQDYTVKLINFNSSGNIETIKTFIYNRHGKVKIETESLPNGKIIKKYVFEYEYY